MSTVLKIVAAVAILLMGPVMYVVSRVHTLELGFSRVQVGDSAQIVRAAMGRPQMEVPSPVGDTDYMYSAKPYPRMWIVGMRDGKVVKKTEVPL